jgi:hypothetical protein
MHGPHVDGGKYIEKEWYRSNNGGVCREIIETTTGTGREAHYGQ